jgi:sodium/potassium-transporting ATPase subunit alpha
VGILSLNDPPRDTVPFAVIKCHTAGVKVIMVTGDQPVTAAAIARECNIISEPHTVDEIMRKEHITFDEANSRSNAIVVHGDEITQMTL